MGLWDEPRWVCPATVTPVDGQGRIDVGRLAAFGRRLMAQGCNGLVPFGTMGEGPSFSVAERLEAVAGLIEAGLDADRLILGIGSAALADMVWLARRAGELKLAGVLATPPFFFRDVTQEGVFAAYARLAEAMGDTAPPLLLYHIPQVCGVPVAVGTVARLIEACPGRIRGIKDSAADLDYTRELLAAVADRTVVVVGAEKHLPVAMAGGARGTICGLANVVPGAIVRLVGGEAAELDIVAACAAALHSRPVIPTVKAALAVALDDPAWSACMPPFEAVPSTSALPLARLMAVGPAAG